MLPEDAFKPRLGRRGGMTLHGGGGGQPTSQTVTQTNIPDWLRPQTEALLGAATQEYFKTEPVTTTDPETGETKTSYNITGIKPFTPYSARPEDYVAGFSPLQQQVQFEAANMMRPGQFAAATDLSGAAGMGGLESAGMAMGYGQSGYESGQMGQMLGLQAAAQAEARARAAEQAAYGYGKAGYEAGLQGQKSGLLGQQIGTQGGQQYGEMGARAGMLGQQLGIAGGQQFGNLGAGYGAMAAGMAPQAQFYGAQAAGLAPQAQRYGQTAADIGAMGLRAEALGRDVGEEARMYARQAAGMGSQYNRMATDPYAVQAFMSPYQQAVINAQKEAAIRDYDIQTQNLKSQAVRSGAYGGARQAIQAAEAQRNLNAQLQNIESMGRQTAYDKAIQAMQYGTSTGLQGLAGAQTGLGTALQGGQLGLSGIGQAMAGQQAGLSGLGQAGSLYGLGLQGLGQAGSLYGLGMQGAGMGLQGVQQQLAGTAQGMQGAQVGLSGIDRMLAGTGQGIQGAQAAMQGAGVGLSGVDRALAAGQLSLAGTDRGLAGTAQGMQGAQVGLQGVSGAQAGYGLAGQQAKTMADIGSAQQAADLARMGFQTQQGAAQQAQEQAVINQAIQNYAMAQQNPAQSLAAYNALLRGYATPTTTVSQYQAAPSPLSQIAGLGTAGAAMYGLANPGGGRKKGGKIKEEPEGIDDLVIRKTLKKVKA